MKRCRQGSGTVRRRLTLAFAFVAACAAVPSAASAQVALTPFGGQNYANPFHVAAPPGDPNRVFVVEAAGTIRLVKNGVTQPQPFLAVPDQVFDNVEGGCECGMFSMAFAPDYATSGLFYVFYTRDAAAQHDLVIREFRRSAANPDLAEPASGRDVLVIPHPNASNHNGGQLQFGPDGLLYIATGDGGSTPLLAQDTTSLLGKLLRIDPRGTAPGQYSIPPGNPLADGAGGNADEIWALGLRNPYRFSFDRSTGDLTIGDVGGGAVEEADFMTEGASAGANFGWPCFEGTQTNAACTPVGPHTPPALEYANPAAGAAAINGGFVIRDPALPALAGRYLFADTYGAVPDLRTAQLSSSGLATSSSLGVGVTNPVSFGQDACGRLYVAAIGGPVSRLDPASGPSSACKLAPSVTLDASPSAAAATTGALAANVVCDEDCTATVTGSIAVNVPARSAPKLKKGKSKKGKKKRKKRRKAQGVPARAFTISAAPAVARVQLGVPALLRLELSGPDRSALSDALAARGTASVSLQATATGGGGGSANATGSVSITKPKAEAKKKKKKKKKKKRKKRKGKR